MTGKIETPGGHRWFPFEWLLESSSEATVGGTFFELWSYHFIVASSFPTLFKTVPGDILQFNPFKEEGCELEGEGHWILLWPSCTVVFLGCFIIEAENRGLVIWSNVWKGLQESGERRLFVLDDNHSGYSIGQMGSWPTLQVYFTNELLLFSETWEFQGVNYFWTLF